MAQVVWQGDEFASVLQKQMQRNLKEAAIYLQSKIRRLISRQQPRIRSKTPAGIRYRGGDPSLPNEPPKQVTGQLMRSIATDLSNVKDGIARVGTNLMYGFWLEYGTTKMAARPYLRAALDQEKDELGKILAQR